MLTADFDDLYRKHIHEIHRHCHRIIRNAEDAKEISNDAFVKAFIYRNQFDPQKGNFRSWIFTIATHLAFDFLDSAAQKRKLQTGSLDDLIYSENDEPQPDAHSEHKQLLKFIDDCLNRLNEKERLAVSLRYLEGFKLQEIAKILGMSSLNSAKNRIQSGEKKLKQCLEKKGIDDDYWRSA
jgi:RNA polymerase sigma-70 factor (ECF subfamily)